MKKVFFLIAFWLITLSLFAQNFLQENNRNNIWLNGYANNYFLTHPNDTISGGTCIDFNDNTMVQCYNELEFIGTNASICDTLGNLLFYTNGVWVGNKNLEIMPMPDTLNEGDEVDWLFQNPNNLGWEGSRIFQGAIILPNPSNDHLYTIFHTRYGSNHWRASGTNLCESLMYTTVDMTQDNGNGAVTTINQPIINLDTLALGMLSACRHANGRDWWLIVWKYDSNKYMPILFDAQGIHPQGWQTVPQALGLHDIQGQTCFSPDGTRYARHEGYDWQDGTGNWLDIFDFDRCTGLLSNQTTINIPVSCTANGLAFSPDSRYLYASTNFAIYQYDMTVPTAQVAATKDTVAVYDNFLDDGFPTYFSFMQLAPNGKIYSCTNWTTRYYHTIENPNSQGVTCNVQQHSLHLNTYQIQTIPNQPYFALGPIDSSACDTLGINNPVSTIQSDIKQDIKVFPNPTSDNTRIEWNETLQKPKKIEIINNIGQIIETIKVENNTTYKDIDTKNLPNGIYFIRLSSAENQTYTTKLVKISD